MKLKVNIVISILLLFILSGCTFYSFVDGSTKYENETKIRIPQFRNDAGNGPPDMIATFTEKTKDFYLQNGKFQLADLNEDVSLECTITNYRVGVAGGTSNQTAAQSKLTISVSVDFIDYQNPDNNLKKNFEGREFYDNDVDLASVESDLVAIIADQIVNDIFNGTTMKTEW